eukprot:202606-Hanusia_phi.AAC.3
MESKKKIQQGSKLRQQGGEETRGWHGTKDRDSRSSHTSFPEAFDFLHDLSGHFASIQSPALTLQAPSMGCLQLWLHAGPRRPAGRSRHLPSLYAHQPECLSALPTSRLRDLSLTSLKVKLASR